MNKTFLAVFFGLFFCTEIFSQEIERKVDSLNLVAISVYKSNPQQAISMLDIALKNAEKLNNQQLVAKTKNNLGIVCRDIGEFEKSKNYSLQAMQTTKNIVVKASALNNIGAVNRKLGLYEEAIEVYLEALKIYEEKSMETRQATVNNNIGMVYSMLNMNEKAIEYHVKAKHFFEKTGNKKGISETYNNIAIIYAGEGNFEKALSYFKYSLDIEKKMNDKKGIAESLNNVGGAYYYLGKIDSAVHYFKHSATIEKSIGNLAGTSASYNNIAQIFLENGEMNQSKKYIDSAYQYASQSKTTQDIENALLNYSEYYLAKNDFQNALKYYKQFSNYKDSISQLSNIESLQELEVKYQTEKKENQILQQRAQLAEKDLEVRRKNTFIYGSLGLALLLGLLGYLLYNQQKLKNHQLQKEGELKTALAKIETQNKLQEQRLRISRDLHDNIGAQLTFIISSIDNLKFGFKDINEKLGAKLTGISSFTTQTIYELRDTIWAMNKENITFEDLQSRIANFIDQAKSASEKTKFSFNIEKNVDKKHIFSSVEGMNMYRIIQEAVNNALKYASAAEVEVTISKENHKYKIEITDNGKGFDPDSTEVGNGLNNMKKRAKEIRGNLQIISSKKGTTILLLIA